MKLKEPKIWNGKRFGLLLFNSGSVYFVSFSLVMTRILSFFIAMICVFCANRSGNDLCNFSSNDLCTLCRPF